MAKINVADAESHMHTVFAVANVAASLKASMPEATNEELVAAAAALMAYANDVVAIKENTRRWWE